MTTAANVTSQIGSVLADVLRADHGTQSRVADRLGWSRQRVFEMLAGRVVSPFEQVKRVILTLRAAKNPQADAPFEALADELDFVTHRRDHALPSDDASFAVMLREVADVVDAHAKATDGENDEADALCFLSALRDLESAVCAFADRIKSRMEMSAPRRVAAWTVRIGKETK